MAEGNGTITVSEAAERLGVTAQRVRALLAEGQLAGRRAGGGWLVQASSVAERELEKLRGRPIAANTAWALIAALSRVGAPSAVSDRRLRFRVYKLVESMPEPATAPERWAMCLASRHMVRRLWAHPGVMDRLRHDARISAGGFEAVQTQDGLTGRDDRWDLYVNARDINAVVADYRLSDDRTGHVLLHAIPAGVRDELLPPGGAPVPEAAGAADLLDENDPRARHAAVELLDRMYREARATREIAFAAGGTEL